MVFFNYSTMQMAAKIVYYGPGLCGKTTNLHWIYNHTSSESRGEMVSLETETDRTLFFDLLPIDVGSVSGFNTRLQLYTVPGQVFYNTTRKLVLKGVDGVVFVADSQRAMRQANVDSFENLRENLSEMGLSIDQIPLVLQFNKRDLDDLLSVEELNSDLNTQGWTFYESSAVNGRGVLETLKGISKLTLIALKERLSRTGAKAEPAAAAAMSASSEPAPAPTARGTRVAAEKSPPPPAAPKPTVAAPPTRRVKSFDALSELEKLRREAMQAKPTKSVTKRAVAPNGNGHGHLARDLELNLSQRNFDRARRVCLELKVQDADRREVEPARAFEVEIDDPAHLESVLLKLSIARGADEH